VLRGRDPEGEAAGRGREVWKEVSRLADQLVGSPVTLASAGLTLGVPALGTCALGLPERVIESPSCDLCDYSSPYGNRS